MKPFDPRLLRYASSVRRFLISGVLLGLLHTVLTIVFAFVVSRLVVSVVDGQPGRLAPFLIALAVTIAARSGVAWGLEALAARTAVQVKSQLRARVLDAVVARGQAWRATQNSARLATLIGPGLDALDEYFARYLPQLILTALATPLLVLVMFSQDVLSGVIVVVTLPLIPVFMSLIGWTTRAAQARQWDRLAGLASAFLDAVNGLATLKVFGREKRQIRRIGELTDSYRVETMKVLQVSFLSGFALEMAASLSVALVAVEIGLRLVGGSLGLSVALFLLLLTPEAYLPLRQVGANFHSAADGVAAADEVFAVLDTAALDETDRSGAISDRHDAGLSGSGNDGSGSGNGNNGDDVLDIRQLSVAFDDTWALAPIDLELPVGALTVISGPSGAGKSTLLAAIVGAVEYSGSIRWRRSGHGVHRDEVSWSGQTPGLLSGSIAANVALGDEIDSGAVAAALDTAAAAELDPGLLLGAAGSGLSGGQAQRVAVARAVYRVRRRHARLLVVDEPTSALDLDTERRLVAGLRTIAESGVAVVMVTHRPGVRAAADAVYELRAPVTPRRPEAALV